MKGYIFSLPGGNGVVNVNCTHETDRRLTVIHAAIRRRGSPTVTISGFALRHPGDEQRATVGERVAFKRALLNWTPVLLLSGFSTSDVRGLYREFRRVQHNVSIPEQMPGIWE